MEGWRIDVGDLVKIVSHRVHVTCGVKYGTVVKVHYERMDLGLPPIAEVMMYTAGLGQFTDWLHINNLERVTPLSRL